jgi:hypothetical protein
MKKLISLLLFCASTAIAATDTNLWFATITITNNPVITNGLIFTQPTATTLLFSNNTTAATVLTNNTLAGATTNLFLHFAAYAIGSPRLAPKLLGSNVIQLSGSVDQPIAFTATGNWCSLVITSRPLSKMTPIRTPISGEGTNAASIASSLVVDLGTLPTNSIPTNAAMLLKYADLTSVQTLQKKLITNGTLAGVKMTNSSWTSTNSYCSNCIGYGWISTNGANYGNAFRSPGTGTDSDQFGSGATATNDQALAVGWTSVAGGLSSTAIGAGAQAYGDSSTAIGAASSANAGGVALGQNSSADTNGIAIGKDASADTNSIAIGPGASAVSGQFVLGTSSQRVDIPGTLAAAITTNSLFKGSNFFSGSVSYTTTDLSSLAFPGPTHNVAVDRVAVYEISGASADFSIDGFTAPSSGFNQEILIINPSAYNMTLVHNAGDPTAGNRIISLTGASRATTGAGCARLWYSFVQSRWIIVGFEP